MLPSKKFLLKTSGACSSQSHARQPRRRPRALDKETMDPARPNDPDPSDPFSPERADHPIFETIEIATEGEDCDECVRRLRAPLMRVKGVKNVKVDLRHVRRAQDALARSPRRDSEKRLQARPIRGRIMRYTAGCCWVRQ